MVVAAGCFPKPNAANIQLRKDIQGLQAQINDLNSRHAADQAQLAAVRDQNAVPTLPQERLAKLFVASGISFKNLVSGEDFDRNSPGDEGFQVAFTPVDQFGDEFKSAGGIKVELFDLAATHPRLGEWSLNTSEAQPKWLSTPVFDGYLLKFRWQTVPTHAKLSVKVTFTEELTGASFDATKEVNVTLPPQTTTQPSQPATQQQQQQQ